MIIFKAIGGVSVVISAIIFYLEIQRYEKTKIDQLDAYISLIEYIKNQIQCYMLPIDRILYSCDKKILNRCGMQEGTRIKNIEDILLNSNIYLDEECTDEIIRFSKGFGTSYKSEQINSCNICRDQLIRYREASKEKNKKDQKVNLSLCLCASLSIILFLI